MNSLSNLLRYLSRLKVMGGFLSFLFCLISIPADAELQSGQVVRVSIGSRVMSTEDSSLDAGKAVVMWTETNTNSQRWLLEQNDKGGYYITNVYSGYYLGGISSSSNGAKIGQVTRSNAATRGSWELVPVEGVENTYQIFINTNRRFCLSAASDVSEGSELTLVTAATADASRVQFHIEEAAAAPNQLTAEIREEMMDRWMAQYYHKASTGHVIGKGGWWGDAEMFEVVLDAYETTGLQEYATMFDELYRNFCHRNGTDWTGNSYNDDIAWMCIACVRAYLLTGNTDYRTKAKSNFDAMYKRANAYGDNTLIWCQGKSGTNSCINGPACVAACYLAIATGLESYYTKARNTYMGERAILYAFSNGNFTGQVYDSYDTKNKKVGNTWSSTYNQGTCLGAAVMLYDHFGDEMFRQDADAIVSWTKSNLANSNGIIKVCQTATGDLTGFKGILMRYIRRYAADLDHPENYEWLAKNAFQAWNNRNSAGISMSGWLHKTPENFNYSDGGDFRNDGVGAFTALSAAYNAHLGVQDHHDAYSTIESENFNFICGAQITTQDGMTVAGPFNNATNIGYRNVEFGNRAATHLNLRMNHLRVSSRLNVYADAPNTGTLLCTVTPEETSQWIDVTVPLNVPLDGTHNIYFCVVGTARIPLLSIDKFSFSSTYSIYPDLTNNGGKFTTSLQTSDNLDALGDDRATTAISAVAPEGEAWIQYQSSAPIVLSGYSIFAGLSKGHDPSAWLLQYSDDGNTWETLDERVEQAFSTRGEQRFFTVSSNEAHSCFRLLFPHVESGATLSLSEWQLMGRSVSQADITHDGGQMTSEGATTYVYRGMGSYLLDAYSITGGNATAWTLYGSTNGNRWVELDSQSDSQNIYPTSAYQVHSTTGYTYYKLEVTSFAEGAEPSEDLQLQLFGALDFGKFHADITQFSIIKDAIGGDASMLFDKDGYTYSTSEGSTDVLPSWDIRLPFSARIIGYSLLSADDADLNPQSVALYGIDDESGDVATLSTRSLSMTLRGQRVTNTVSSSRQFNHLRLDVGAVANEGTQARLAEVEIYTTTMIEDETIAPRPVSIQASAEAVAATESVEKLVDMSRMTRYRTSFTKPVSIAVTFAEPQSIKAYTLTAAKDEPTRDPQAWTLEGSSDGSAWTVIDQRTDQAFSHRYATQFYDCNSEAEPYTQYRLTITETAGANQVQLSELQFLLTTHPTAVRNISVDPVSFDVSPLYDLQGRRVQSPRRGIFIQGGRKVIR